jgi:YbbR domain-containing protein
MKIFKNYHIKLLSILSALLLWFFVVGVENYVYFFPNELPVRVLNLGQNVSVANELLPIKVRYRSPDGLVNINSNEVDLYVDAEGLGEGEYSLPVEFINKNPKVDIIAVVPADLVLKLEAVETKEIGVVAEVVGDPDDEYELKNTDVDTARVTINGAASAIEALTELPIRIALDGTETADFSRKVTLEAPPDWNLNGKTVTFDPEVVLVDIEIRKKKVTDDSTDDSDILSDGSDDLGNQPVEEGNLRKNLMVQIVPEDSLRLAIKEIVPQNILLTVEGSDEEISTLNGDSINLLLTNASVKDGQYQVSLDDLILPPGSSLKIIRFSPEKVSIRF